MVHKKYNTFQVWQSLVYMYIVQALVKTIKHYINMPGITAIVK